MSDRPMSPRPGYRITLGDEDITPRLNGRLVSLKLTSQRGQTADQLELTLADHDDRLALPPTGARLTVALGWQDEGLIERGTFIVDELDHQGSPDQLNLKARAADMRHQLPGKRSQSWHDITLGDIIDTIAQRHQLTPFIGHTLGRLRVAHIDQTEESDLNFLTRLGQRFDAIATVKSGRMLFTRAGDALTASGRPLPGITLTRHDGDKHRFHRSDRDTATGVRAFWHDTAAGTRRAALVGAGDRVRDLRATYAREADALEAARSELRRLQRSGATFSLTLARGRADLVPETPLTLKGWKSDIDGTDWLVTRVEDSLNDSGYGTSIQCEVKTT